MTTHPFRTWLLLALILIPLLVLLIFTSPTLTGNATFSVGVNVLGAKVLYDSFSQVGVASPTVSGLVYAPVSTYFSDVADVYSDIPTYFSSASNFSVNQSNVTSAVDRTGDRLNWSMNGSNTVSMQFVVPPPTITTTDASSASSLLLLLAVSAQTPLRQAQFSVTVPTGYTDYVLIEDTTGSDVVRTQTYNLVVSGTTATFENVFFTPSVLNRSLRLSSTSQSATPSPSTNPSVTHEPSPQFMLPREITAIRGKSTTVTVSIQNPTDYAFAMSFITSPETLSIVPTSLTLSPGEETTVELTYAPVASSVQEKGTLSVQGFAGAKQYVIDLLPENKARLVIDANITEEGIVVSGEAYADEDIELTAELRTDTGEIIDHANIFRYDDRFAHLFLKDALAAGTYEACVRLVAASGEIAEKCHVLFVKEQAQIQEPGTINSATTSLRLSFGWVVAFIIVAGILGMGVYGVHDLRVQLVFWEIALALGSPAKTLLLLGAILFIGAIVALVFFL